MPCTLDDPAIRGFSNNPVLTVNVMDAEEFYSTGHTDYYVGREGSDQYNLWSGEVLGTGLERYPELFEGKSLYVVRTWDFVNQYLQDQFRLLQVQYYNLAPKAHSVGALKHTLPDGYKLTGGWSSNSAHFNRTGISALHVTEVYVGTPEGPEGLYFAPVEFVRREVGRITGGFYALREVHPALYVIERTQKQSRLGFGY